jgi:hypothetical protein
MQCVTDINEIMTMNAVSDTQADWARSCSRVKKPEVGYWHTDGLVEEELERHVINTGFASSEDSNADNYCQGQKY